jgi:hypothetical protein
MTGEQTTAKEQLLQLDTPAYVDASEHLASVAVDFRRAVRGIGDASERSASRSSSATTFAACARAWIGCSGPALLVPAEQIGQPGHRSCSLEGSGRRHVQRAISG